MPLLAVPALQMDVAYACNLHCRGCTHYSNYGLKGVVPFEEGETWLRAWANRVRPKQFDIAGGEPMLNAELNAYIRLVADLWPEATRAVVTNGYFLERREGLFQALSETGTRLQISVHTTNSGDLDRLQKQIDFLEVARRRWPFEAETSNGTQFYSTYRGEGADMRPFTDNDPRASWEACCNKVCKTIHRGRLWKCPPIAYLELVAAKFGFDGLPDWKPYLAYEGIGPDVPDADLLSFFNAEEEDVCTMCPAKLEYHEAL